MPIEDARTWINHAKKGVLGSFRLCRKKGNDGGEGLLEKRRRGKEKSLVEKKSKRENICDIQPK